jgi:hypothetical protein
MIEAVLSHVVWIVGGLWIAIALFWTVSRSNSFFYVRYRLWRLARSDSDISDDGLRQALHSHADLVSFRTLLMRADTVGEMRRILDYAQKNELEPGMLGDCGHYFDRSSLTIKKKVPALLTTKAKGSFYRLLLITVVILSAYLGFQHRALLSFKDDHTWFWLSPDMAQVENSDQAILLPDECPKTHQGAGGFSAQHVKALCETYGSKRFTNSINDGIKEQQGIALMLMLFCAWAYGRLWRHLRCVRAAHAVQNWIAFKEKAST